MQTGELFLLACGEPLRAEWTNRIGRENGGILRYGVKFLVCPRFYRHQASFSTMVKTFC